MEGTNFIYMFDPPNILKLTHNVFKQNFKINNNIVTKNHVDYYYNSKWLASKLTYIHISLGHFEQMNVFSSLI